MEHLAPRQMAVGVRDAGAILGIAVQMSFDKGQRGDKHSDVLQLDLKNGYDTISRDAVYTKASGSLHRHYNDGSCLRTKAHPT